MDSYDLFNQDVKRAADEFKKIPKDEVIRLVSHLDADGISAASIMVKCLNNENRKYSISIIQQVKKEILQNIINYIYFH